MSRTSEFEDKVAIVTGAGSGIGAATAGLLAERGARVALVGLQRAALEATAQTITEAGGEALVLDLDVADADAMAGAVEQTVQHFGGLHLAVNNAGISGQSSDVSTLSLESWRRTLEVNLFAQFYGLRAELPAIERSGGGAVVNITSVFADRGMPQRAAYSTSKHAGRGLVRSVAMDWAPRGVRVNELQPGVIDTPMLDEGREETEARATLIPIRRMGRPREVASAIAFLLSDDASYVVGAHLAVDGGFLD